MEFRLNWKHWSTAAGFAVLILGMTHGAAYAQEYEGPTVLSRSGGGVRPQGERSGEDPKLRLFISANAIYTNGNLPAQTDSNGNLVQANADFGFQASFGVYGTRRWKRTSLGIDYTGDYRQYARTSNYNGSNNYLGLTYGNQVNRRTLVSGSVTAGTTNTAFGGLNGLVGTQVGNILPTTDIFDTRTYFLYGGMGISRQESNRLGYELRGNAFRVERHANTLVSVEGYTAAASGSYRLDLRQRVGVTYNFTHFDYPKAFGEADINSATIFYSYQLSRLWRAQIDVGGYLTSSAGSRTVLLDPAIFALLGIRSVTEAFERTVALPTTTISLDGKTKNSTFHLSAFRGVGAGNGLSLTTSEQSISAIYDYAWNRSITTTANGYFSRSTSLSNSAGSFVIYTANLGASYQTRRRINYHLAALYRHSNVSTLRVYGHDSYEMSLGVGWSATDFSFLH